MKILIVEGNSFFALEVEMQLKELGYEKITILDNVEAAQNNLRSKKIDLLIVDVNLEEQFDGLCLAKPIGDEKVPVIFMTGQNDEQTFQEVMQVNPAGFLVKPFDKITLRSCIDRVIDTKETNRGNTDLSSFALEDCFFVKQKDVLSRVEFEDILWIEVDGNYIIIQLGDKKFITKMSLTKVEEKMNVPYFIRVHKKFLVNIKKVDAITSGSEIIIKDIPIPIGPKYRNELLDTIRLEDYS